jgi:hypothetical protein
MGVIYRKCGQHAPWAEVEKGSSLGELGGEVDVRCRGADFRRHIQQANFA